MRGGAGKRPVVALNKDAKVVGMFPSISAMARYMGVPHQNISTCIKEQRPYKRMRIMYEEEFKRLWMFQDTDRLKFGTRKEIRSEALRRRWSCCSQEEKEKFKRKVSETKRIRYLENLSHPLRISHCKCSHPVMCVETGLKYPSINQAASAIGVRPGSLHRRVVKGLPCKGYTFVRLKDADGSMDNKEETYKNKVS